MITYFFDNLLIGSGEANKYLAWALAKSGERTAIVERSMIGGSCPNTACLPSKNVIHSAKVASLVKRAGEFGISTGLVQTEMAAVFSRKARMVDDLVVLHQQRFRENGVELIMGEARFTGPNTVQVKLQSGGIRNVEGVRVFVNVGTHATLPEIPGLAAAKPMTHVEALNLQRLPKHLVVMGGGYVGIEFAQAMRRFGSKVTIIHRGEQLLGGEDKDVSSALCQMLERDGIKILLQTELHQVNGLSGDHIRMVVLISGDRMSLDATDLLVAVGCTPNTADLDVTKADIALDKAGYIHVNDRLETTAPNTWAMGECAGSPQYTHAALDDFRVVHTNITGGRRSTRNRLVPYCLFTDPELARVGLNEQQAKARKISYRVARLPMKSVLRTRTISEAEGFIKALVGMDDRILGFSAFGAEASELLAAVQTAMLAGVGYQTLRDAIFTHPTMAEGLGPLFATLSPAPGRWSELIPRHHEYHKVTP